MQEKEPSKPDLGAEGTLGQQATAGRSLDSREPVFSTDDPLLTLGGLPTGLPASDPRAAMPGWGDPDAGSRYEIQTSLGQGGMGRVDLALDRRLRRNVAIKRIRLDIQHSDVVVSRFVTEATALARLAHPHIVPIYDFGQDGQGLFLVMEYLAGGNLAELLKRNGPIPERQVLDYLIPICEALQAAHEAGIVHRDIKPGNLLIGQDGRAKLTDFGLVKMLRPTGEAPEHPTLPPSITASGIPLGTVDYMPPEQRQAADRVDARSDLWSLAATAYALLTGESPRTIRLDRLPAPWRPILSRGLEEAPDRRFTSAAEFRQALLSLSSQAHAPSTSTVVVGQCPHCQSLNESQRRFCHTCSRPLYRECRTCRSEMAVWYDVCGECGQRHSDWVAQRRRQLLDWQQQTEAAAQQGNYLLAQKWIQEIRSASDEGTATLTPWLQTFAPEVEQKLQAQRIEVTRLVRVALEALQQYNYAEAVAALAQIPTSVHGTVVPATGTTIDQLWRQTQTQAATVERLEGEIRRRVKEKRLKQLLPLVEEFLLLQPTHAKILKLSEQLRARELPAAVTPVAEMARAPLYLQSSFNPPEVAAALPDVERSERSGSSQRWALLMAGTAVGVVLLAGVAWAWWGQSVPDPGAATGAPSVSASAPAASEPTIINSVGMTLQWIPPGSLRMGSPLDEVGRLADEEPQALSIDGYYLGAFEVSVAQYHRVMDLAPPPATEADLPKTDLTWEQAVAFCERLTRQPAEFQARRRYYLPSEPQWEYARRAGQKSPFALDVELEQLPEYQAVEEGRLLPCNATTPNAWGIHGLAGNAREWTSNWYAPNLSVFRVRPLGPAGGQERSVRGGKAKEPYSYRCAQRDRLYPHRSADDLGFRVAMHFLPAGLVQTNPLASLDDRRVTQSTSQSNRRTEIRLGEQSTTTAADSFLPERRYTTQEQAAQQRQQDHATEHQLPVEVQNSIGLKLRWCPPGEFAMGSPLTEEGRGDDEWLHRVQLSRGFYLGVHEITQMQYELVMGKLPHQMAGRHSRSPVTGLSYRAALEFCTQLSQLPAEVEAGRRYRLPTEAEWEYACRADTETAYFFGDDPIHWRQYVTVRNLATATPVAQLWPNAWGFHDMLGTPYEYCSGWYGRYPTGLVQDPAGFEGGTNVVVRGGDADKKVDTGKYDVADFRSAKRSKTGSNSPHNAISFRVVMIPAEMDSTEVWRAQSAGEAPRP